MTLSMDDIKNIAKQLIASKDKKQYNNIIKLVNNLNVENQQLIKEDELYEQKLRFIIMSLFQIFKKLFARGDLSNNNKSKDISNELKQFNLWCKKIYESFKNKLLFIIGNLNFECSLSLDSMDVYLQLLELESIHFSSNKDAPFFPNKSLKKLIISLFQSTINDEDNNDSLNQSENQLIIDFSEKYYQKFVDIQYYFQLEYNQLLTNDDTKDQFNTIKSMSNWLTIMNHDNYYCNDNLNLEIFVSNPPQAIENTSKFKSLIEKNWLIQLSGNLTIQQYKSILLILHKRIIPYFQQPTKLMDFLTDSYNLNYKNDIIIPLLSLNGLFELMRRYNLEYPNFFIKLYEQVTIDLMHTKYRPRFFRLMDLFLSSTHLSTHLVAAFIKKLARLTLESPPASIVTIIPFIYNLLKRHPNCMIMLHNPLFINDPFSTIEKQNELKNLKLNYTDPFNPNEKAPELSNAVNSSLWELETLMNHYHPNVATLAKIFNQPFKKLNYNLEDFLDWSYDSLITAESTRKLKVLPTLEFENFDKVFIGEDETNSSNGYLNGVDW